MAERNRLIAGDLFSGECTARHLLSHVTSKWGVLVLVALHEEDRRWSDLARTIGGISEKMLAQTLRMLEGDGLLVRDARPVVPPHVVYRLTDEGREAADLLLPLLDWVRVRTAEAERAAQADEAAEPEGGTGRRATSREPRDEDR
ncbi:winged helix-turn-helix transcriptional regulator [Nocardiopsis xinjiangensis]|uniref:winged helix-turn-helix transcriptional regulator n=1 Tax=Nocardiopsis xinjiangensis TaxID=124285 RepID=UPI00036E6DC6|nr:helix-turn-helix domain-containing protein [Nocardiopsis xinjiangensis]